MRQFYKRIIAAVLCLSLCCGLLLAAPAQAASPAVEQQLASMTLREKVGQLFQVRPDALDFAREQPEGVTKMTPAIREALAQYPVGGVTLFGRNIDTPSQLGRLIADFQEASAHLMLIAVDEEGGRASRLATNPEFYVPAQPKPAEVGATGDPKNAYRMGYVIGTYLRPYGFTADFAPVADVNTNPNNTVIGARAFSPDPKIAAQMVAAAVHGYHDAGILCTLKHFPGHGDTGEDSHYGTATTTKTWEEMKAVEMLPFAAGIQAGADLIMTAHITTPNATTDGLPASFSYTMMTERLRGEMGFQGVIIADALEMKAISDHFTDAEGAIAALNAGVDILLMPTDLRAAFDGVVAAVESGRLPEARINESLRRILTLKEKAQHMTPVAPSAEKATAKPWDWWEAFCSLFS